MLVPTTATLYNTLPFFGKSTSYVKQPKKPSKEKKVNRHILQDVQDTDKQHLCLLVTHVAGIGKSTKMPSNSKCVFAPMCLFEGSLDTNIIYLKVTQFTAMELFTQKVNRFCLFITATNTMQ